MGAIEVRLLESFLMVAQESNVTRAAARLHLTQQAVSSHVQQLEHALGVTLLVRTSRGVLLTPAGDELAAGGKAVVADLEALAERVREVARGQCGKLRLACCPYSTALFAAEVAGAMESAVPGIEVDLTTLPTPRAEMEQLESGDADAAFMWVRRGDPRLRHAEVRTDSWAVAVAMGHRLAERETVTMADLADEPVVMPDIFISEDARSLWLAEPRPDGRPAVRGPIVERVEECLLAVARGRGVWLAPQPLARWAPVPSVRWVPIEDAEPSPLAVVWTSRASESLISTLVAEVRKATSWEPEPVA
ncbi:LysR family transcriptional regulator [Streptomyces sp. SID3343]|uniref:LysR family transcriptional regulator n=1 Tax=Streptomyces sp. SID3343 TaxID=2690260 RepID=UPI00136F3B13|nr:LysR family transcriptional regulator [Streptomyces sp. SID3343]MYW05291.1 LysR family transcriptional regulator [Streptomyces sp. SID3343]